MVTSSQSADGSGRSAPVSNSYATVFEEHFPYYLAIGMSAEQYWDGEPSLAKAYRKADEIRQKRRNEELWLQGMYIYEALCDVSPMLHAFAKRGTKPRPYSDRPYAITNRDREEEHRVKMEKEREKAKNYMEAKMAAINKRFKSN